MSGRIITEFQKLANDRGWTFEEIAKRWGKSERQLSRIAKAGEQRDLDAVNGLPKKKKSKLK